MKNILFVLSCISVLLFSCTQQNGKQMTIDPPKIGIDQDTLRIIKDFKGLYSASEGNNVFYACDQPGIIHAVGNAKQLDSLYKIILPNAYAGQAIYIEMQAEINSSSNKGFADLLLVKECSKAEQKNHKNNCINSDYWGFGSEPFWQLQISEKENLIDLYEPMEQKTTHFNYATPEIKNGNTYYKTSLDGNKINIVIKKEKCNGAIDPQYDYSVQIQLNDKSYNGCALKQ